MNTNKIRVKSKAKFGKKFVYPVCKKAKSFTDLTGSQTLTPKHLDIIKNNLEYIIIEEL